MWLEPPGADVPHRRYSGAVSTSERWRIDLGPAAAAAAAVLAITSTGHLVVAAVLVGIAGRDRRSVLAAVAAVAAVAVRFGTTTFDGLAGLQTVLGPAVTLGATTAVLATALAAISLIVGTTGWAHALAAGPLAAALACGPGPSEVLVRSGAVVLASTLSVLIAVTPRLRAWVDGRRWVAVALAIGALALAGWPR